MRVYLPLMSLVLVWTMAQESSANSSDSLFVFDYQNPTNYEIGGIKFIGLEQTDERALLGIMGLRIGDNIQIPGPQISKAMKALWNLHLFEDIQVSKEKIVGDIIFLEVTLLEPPRYSKHSFKGVKKSKHDDLNEVVQPHLVRGGILTENNRIQAGKAIQQYYTEKGYLDSEVSIREKPDPNRPNSVVLDFEIERNERTKIKDISFAGNESVKPKRLRKLMSSTKRKGKLFTASKFIPASYEIDKKQIIAYYNTLGYRDAKIVKDSMWRNAAGEVMLHLDIDEGNQYFFRNISWKGQSKYSAETLSEVLGINKGDVYNTELLESRLRFSPDGRDISTLYMDDGYLFFDIQPNEKAVENDSIDLEIRLFEGPQATIGDVRIVGNTTTNEHVIRRELRTKPGQKFSRSDIIRSQRQLINMGYFNPETMEINTPVNPQNGTVDIEYVVEEKSSDQFELSAGWGGAGNGVIGTLGVTFNNFSLRNLFNGSAWNPLPMGDGQKLSLRVQSTGSQFQSYNFSFVEPWLGGQKPTNLTVGGYFNNFSGSASDGGAARFNILAGTVSLGTQLKWPDDNFISTTALNLQRYSLENWTSGLFRTDDGKVVSDGEFFNFSITQTITRNTINNPLFPTEGSRISFSLQFTPPYSLFSDQASGDTPQEQFKWIEYHKWKFDSEWYTSLVGKLVLRARAKFGFLGRYNNDLSISPFGRFQLGGDGISNQQVGFNGTDIISLRGYETTDLENNLQNGSLVATPLYNKISLELRYPLSLNPSATIYGLVFAEGGNAWQTWSEFNPFELKRSVGAGIRVFLPMFGLLGFDYGIGFDKDGPRTLNNLANFSLIIGFEPE